VSERITFQLPEYAHHLTSPLGLGTQTNPRAQERL
jgi:hypothetical protein